ncbi:diguanylate cyclase [Citromicrobium bathyomarinum]|uniref:diguanylate cyclase domain-containing protein n=1 Tax=Citromicrobium bathyomarinum TaxID=72174 RepID=UPI00315B0E78
MPHGLGMAQQFNHDVHGEQPMDVGPVLASEVREAMDRIADVIVQSGEGLTLESLIKAFWRTYSTPEGNIVSIHEGRSGAVGTPGQTPAPLVAEDAFARLTGRMDQLAQNLGFLSDKIGSEEERMVRDVARAARAYREDLDQAEAETKSRRRHDDGEAAPQSDTPAIRTNLPDRAQFEVALNENFRIARNEVEPLSVAICSVSRIDRIVQDHGLHTATRLMERVASTLSHATRGECYSARKSASEFIMLARGITISQFQEVLEQSIIDLSLRRWHDKFSNKTLGMIEMHVGIAHVFDFANPSEAMRAADLAHERAMLEHNSTVVLADARDLDDD